MANSNRIIKDIEKIVAASTIKMNFSNLASFDVSDLIPPTIVAFAKTSGLVQSRELNRYDVTLIYTEPMPSQNGVSTQFEYEDIVQKRQEHFKEILGELIHILCTNNSFPYDTVGDIEFEDFANFENAEVVATMALFSLVEQCDEIEINFFNTDNL